MSLHLFLISVLLMFLLFFIGPTREKQDSILEALKDITENQYSDKLLEKYPAGYVLFGLSPTMDYGIRSEKRSIPYSRHLLDEYEFKWDRVKISELTKDVITVELPDIRYKPLNTQVIGCAYTIKREPLGQSHILFIKPKGVKNRIFIELVKDTNSMLIFVIGFSNPVAETET